MQQRLNDAARAVVMGALAVGAEARGMVSGWVRSGDVTLIFVLCAIALILLIFIVVPKRRGY